MPVSNFPATVRSAPLFSGLTEQDKDNLLQAGKLRSFSPGQFIFHHGDPVSFFYIICNGTIKIFRETPDGDEITTDVKISGSPVGANEILESFQTYQRNAMAIDDVKAIQFPVSWLKESAKKNGIFALNLLASVAEHARLAQIEVEHQATMSAAQLVACFLQRTCVLHDLDPKGFDLPYSKTLIASRLGMELETLSRTLSKLKEHGVVVNGTRVTFSDPAEIEEYVCGHCSIAEDCPTHKAIQQKVRRSGGNPY